MTDQIASGKVVRKKTGLYVVVYYNDPMYKGTERYLARNDDGTYRTTECDFDSATKFAMTAHARYWLERYPDAGPGQLPGRVCEVIEETRTILGGESMEDLNHLLRQIREVRPCSDQPPAPTPSTCASPPSSTG